MNGIYRIAIGISFLSLLSACNKEQVNVKTIDTVPITSEEKARLVKDREKNRLRLNQEQLNQIDILSKQFKERVVKQGVGEITNLYEGLRFEEIERELGNYKVKQLNDKGHLITFNAAPNIDILFDRNFGAIPDKNANVQRVYLKRYAGEGSVDEVIKIWGKPKYRGYWPSNIEEYYYEFNEPHPKFIILQIRNDKLMNVSEMSKHAYINRIAESYSITHPNIILDVLEDNVRDGFLKNRLNRNGIKVGDKTNHLKHTKYGKYEVISNHNKITKISMDMSSIVHDDIEALRSKWGSDYEMESVGNKEITIYEGKKGDGIVTKIVSYENGKLVEIANVSENHQDKEDDLKVADGDTNIIEQNGTAQYKIPDNFVYENAFGKKQFKIFGYKIGDDAKHLIEKLGQPTEEKVGRSSSNTYVYDNFEVSIKDDKVFSYMLYVDEEHIQSDDLEQRWKEQPKAKTNHYMRFNTNKDDDYYSEIQFDDNGVVENVAVYGEEFVGD